MNSRDVVRRLRAFQEGRPLPKGSTLHLRIADDEDLLVVAFLRMGGESRPWGIAYGHPHDEPEILWVPEGRNRDLVADMCARFAPVLLSHFRTPGYTTPEPERWEDLAPLRQLWLPNPSHLDMLHHLAYAFTFTKWGAGARGRLNAFGRLCGWLQREAARPGTQHVQVATETLRESFTFPAQTLRQGHLGFLMAWLDTPGDRDTRHAAATEAERLAISTSLDPTVEREETEPLVDGWHEATDAGDAERAEDTSRMLGEVLTRELRHRFELTVAAMDRLRTDDRRENSGVEELVRESLKEQWYQHTRLELGIDAPDDGPAFVPSPETDRYPAAAASRYQVYLASEDFVHAVLLHDDVEMQAEAIAAGDAFRGTIVEVRDIGEGRATRPIWVIEDPDPGLLRLREGSWVCLVGMPNRKGTIEGIDDLDDGARRVAVEITGWKTKPDRAADPSHVGQPVMFASNPAYGINRMKSRRVWERDVPGAWLTHARPRGPRARVPDEVAEDIESLAGGTDG